MMATTLVWSARRPRLWNAQSSSDRTTQSIDAGGFASMTPITSRSLPEYPITTRCFAHLTSSFISTATDGVRPLPTRRTVATRACRDHQSYREGGGLQRSERSVPAVDRSSSSRVGTVIGKSCEPLVQRIGRGECQRQESLGWGGGDRRRSAAGRQPREPSAATGPKRTVHLPIAVRRHRSVLLPIPHAATHVQTEAMMAASSTPLHRTAPAFDRIAPCRRHDRRTPLRWT